MADCKVNRTYRKRSQDFNVQQFCWKLWLINLRSWSWSKWIRRNISKINQLSWKAFCLVSLNLLSKKLYKHYIVQCLSNISSQYAASAEADSLLLKLLVNGEVSTETVSLAYRQELSSNQYFPFLRQLLLGDFEGFNAADKSSLVSSGVKISHLERKIKLQAIPRILSGINQASYSQVS